MAAEVLAPELKFTVNSCQVPGVAGAVKVPTGMPLMLICSGAGEPGLQLEIQAENW